MIIRRRIKDEPAIYQRDKRPPSRPTPAAPALISMRHSARPLTIYDNCHYPVRGGRRPSISAAASSVKDSAPLIRQNLALPPMTPEREGGAREASMMAARRGFKSPLSESADQYQLGPNGRLALFRLMKSVEDPVRIPALLLVTAPGKTDTADVCKRRRPGGPPARAFRRQLRLAADR